MVENISIGAKSFSKIISPMILKVLGGTYSIFIQKSTLECSSDGDVTLVTVCNSLPFLSQGSEYRCLLLHCNNPSLPHSQEGIFFSYLFASNIVERIVIDIHMSGHCWAAANLMPPFVRSSPC